MTTGARECGSCTLCCKVLGVHGVNKPQHKWCGHCAIGKGCTIYADRPQDCRDFHCMYVMPGSGLGDHWLPSRSKMVLCSVPSIPRIEIHVDETRPDAWRKEPFYSDIKAWSRAALQSNGHVMVYLPDRIFAILPDKDVDMGKPEENSQMVHVTRMTVAGPVVDIEKISADDARLPRP